MPAQRRWTLNSARRGAVAYLVIVRKGPSWSLSDIEPFCRLISRRFEGEVWAFGSYSADVVIERVRLRVVKEEPLRDLKNRVQFIRQAFFWIRELRAAKLQRVAIVSLEPFTGGLLGVYAANRTDGVLICEINGVYGSRHNSAGVLGCHWASAPRTLFRRLLGAFVIRNATAVRLLFRDQLRGFVRLPAQVISREFFEICNLQGFRPGIEEPFILSIGFPFRVKGFDILCRAFMQIAGRHPTVKLVLIGYRVPEEVSAHGLEHPQIETHPGVTHAEVAQWMNRCAIFVLPSRTEGMGRVLLEAGAAGKCRVATRVDGIPTVVEDGVDGVLVETENVSELAQALDRLICDPALRRRLGDAAKLRVAQQFSEDAYLDHYEELVSAALNRQSR